MSFPTDPLAVLVELLIGGVWTDVTSDVYLRSPITITRGHADEGARVDAGKCSLQFNNRQGKYSPRNPNSPYFGLIGRNTPVRVTVTTPTGTVSRRFVGEISSWPARWDVSGRDVWVPVEASGILRRLGQRDKPLASALRRETTAPGQPTAAAYWPLEDAEGAASFSSATGGPPMRYTGSPDLASSTVFACSDALPVLANGVRLTGQVPPYTPTGQTQFRLLLAIPPAGTGDFQNILTLTTTGSAASWDIVYTLPNHLGARAFDANDTMLADTGNINFDVNGNLVRLSLEMTQNGANIDYSLTALKVGSSTAITATNTVNNATVGQVTGLTIARDEILADTTVGHVTIHPTITSIFDLQQALNAWSGESAGRRIERLCAENDVPISFTGDVDDTQPVGAQQVETFLTLLDQAADVDGGLLTEDREELALRYRTNRSLYNQGE